MPDQALTVIPPGGEVVAPRQPSALEILQAAVSGGITKENVEVVTKIKEIVREEQAYQSKIAANRSFFVLRKEMPVLYADKQVRKDDGAIAFEYCSPQEIKDMLEPLCQKHGFATMATQTMDGETKVTVTIKLIHEQGHEFESSFTVRIGQENKLVKGPQVVAAASTTAERHCLIKLFGLRTRINPAGDARNEGTAITEDQAKELHRRVTETNSDHKAFLKFCGVPVQGDPTFEDYKRVMSSRYPAADEMLRRKEQRGR